MVNKLKEVELYANKSHMGTIHDVKKVKVVLGGIQKLIRVYDKNGEIIARIFANRMKCISQNLIRLEIET